MSDTNWRADAACREEVIDESHPMLAPRAQQREVRLVCFGCPVGTECLAEALDNRVQVGVWGAMTERERRALLRRRPEVTSWADALDAARQESAVATTSRAAVLPHDLEAESLRQDPTVLEEFEAFYRAEFRRLVGFVIKHGFSEHDAMDAAQEAFIQALQQWRQIREPRAWVRKVVMRCLPRSQDVPIGDLPDQPDPLGLTSIDIAEQTPYLIKVLRRLPPQQRAVVTWKLDGFTAVEIGQALGMSPENVRKTLQRARAALSRMWQGNGETTP